MIPNEHKAKVASITVIVDDSPVVMIFNDIHAALKLKRRLREVFPDTVFTKNIEDEMLEKQAKKIAGLVIQRRLFISPTLSDEDLRIEIQGKINSETLLKKSVAPVAVGAPWPSSYESALSEKIKEAEKHVEKFANVSQPQATGVDIRSKMVYSTPAGSATFAKPEQQQQQQQQQPQPQVFARRSDSYVGQFLTPAGLAAATGASQVQGDISVHAASIIPYSVHNGVTNPLTSANIFGPSAVNPGPNLIALGNVPLAQGSTNNMAASTSIASGQGPQIRVLTIQPQLQANAVANQQGGYASALPNRILAHQPILGANYQGLATYATTGSQPAPYVAAIQQNAQQIAQLIPGSAVLTQLAAPGAMVGKVASQAPNVMPLSVQPAVHPAATPVSISSTGVIGHSKSQLGSADLSIPTSATVTDQQADQTKVSDHLPSLMNISYYSQPPMSDNSEIILTIDSDEYTDYPNAQEAFYINSHNILSINDIPTTEQVGNSSSPLLELITRWSRMIRQSRPASPMSVTQQEGEFYQYYKRLNVDHTHHLTVKPAAPKLWSPADQLSLFICAYDQVFAGVSDNIKQAWEGHKRAFLDSSITTTKAVAHAIESNAIDVHDLSSSSSHSSPSPSPVHSSFLPQSSSSLSSSSKTVENVMEAPTTQQLDDLSQGAAKPIIRLISPLKEVRESESSAFPKHLFTTVPTNSNMSALQAGQELLNVGFPDKQKFFSDLLTQFPSAVNVSELTQINPNLSSLLSNSVSSLGVDQRQKQDLGVQEATAQMLTHLSFVNNKSTDIDSLLRNCQPPLTYLKTPNELPLKTLFTAPMSSCASSLPTIDCLFPPNKNIQIDVILLLYLLSFGGAVDEVKSDNDDLNFLPSETSSQILKEYTRKRCIEIQNKLLILYHKEDFFELKAGASSLYSRGNIRATIANYVTCAQNTNLDLHLSLQADNNPGKAVLSLPCVLLDSEHLALILPRTKEVSVGKDKEIDKLLESVAFMNGKLTRKEFYSRGKASQVIPSISSMATMADWHTTDKHEDEEQLYEREYAADPPRKRMRLPIRLATGEVLYRAPDGSFTSNPAKEPDITPTIAEESAEQQRVKSKGHTYASKEAYFISEDAVRSQMAFLCTKVMASPDSRQIVAELVSFLADYEALSSNFTDRLTEEIDISLDILLKDVGGHGPLAGLSRERQRKLQERQKQLIRLCLQGNGNAKDKALSAIELDKIGYTANNLVISLGKYLEKARYSIKHMFVFDIFLGLRIADGVSDLDPSAGRGVKFFLKRLDSELKTVRSNKKMTKRQKSLAIELKEYKNELKREGIRQSQNDMVAVHSSTLTELFAIFTIILRKQFNHCVYALEKVFLGCERYHRFLSVMYVKDLSAVIRNMLLSSILSMPEAILDQRMHVLDSLTTQTIRTLTSGVLRDESVPIASSLTALIKTKGSRELGSAEGTKNTKDSKTRPTQMQPMFSQKVKQAFGLSKEFSRLESLFTQKLLEKDVYATRSFSLPVRAGITGCLVVGKIQSELKGLNDVIELDLIIPLFYLLIHSVDVTTAEMTKLYVRGLFYCIQPSIGTKERIEVVKKYLQLMKHIAIERESWTIIESYYQSLAKRHGDDEDSDGF